MQVGDLANVFNTNVIGIVVDVGDGPDDPYCTLVYQIENRFRVIRFRQEQVVLLPPVEYVEFMYSYTTRGESSEPNIWMNELEMLQDVQDTIIWHQRVMETLDSITYFRRSDLTGWEIYEPPGAPNGARI